MTRSAFAQRILVALSRSSNPVLLFPVAGADV